MINVIIQGKKLPLNLFSVVNSINHHTLLRLSFMFFATFSGDMGHFCLFDLILYVPSTIFQLNRDKSSWVEPVLS